MSVINSSDVYKIICKTLNTVSAKVMRHSQIVGYTLFKMLQYENEYSLDDIIDYTMIGVLHDIGLYRTEIVGRLADYELNNVWEHSVYGHLFLRYLSPLRDKADIILYHHLDFNKYSQIQSDHLKVCAHLAYADKHDTYHRLHKTGMPVPRIYFEEQKNITFSARSQHIFELADEKYRINAKIKDGSYLNELNAVLGLRKFKEAEIRDFLKMLIYTIDFQSEVTVLHTLATTTFATRIAQLMQLHAAEVENIYYGALLHDIGKIMIPVSILESPNRLEESEMEIMKTHVLHTESILKGIVNREVLDIAIRHHEKLDGSGYPNGYSGDQLTPAQRIVAVADILSALYQKRSYKDSFELSTIAQIIRDEAMNGKLCPQTVAYTIKYMNQIMLNFEAQREETMGLYMKIKEQFDIIYARFKEFENNTGE